jgi:hypothetical protein
MAELADGGEHLAGGAVGVAEAEGGCDVKLEADERDDLKGEPAEGAEVEVQGAVTVVEGPEEGRPHGVVLAAMHCHDGQFKVCARVRGDAEDSVCV